MPQEATLFDMQLHAQAERLTIATASYREECDRLYAEVNRLLAEKAHLQQQVQHLAAEHRAQAVSLAFWRDKARAYLQAWVGGPTPQPGASDRPTLAKELTRLAAQCHPDRWQGSPVAEECTKAVLRLRDSLSREQER
jgi:hypothetical protein